MRFSRPIFALIGFMIAAWVILFLVTDVYLIPALKAVQGADSIARKQLAALSALVVAILLLILRPGRFFLPGKSGPKTRTKYVDAWAAAGERMEIPKDERAEEP